MVAQDYSQSFRTPNSHGISSQIYTSLLRSQNRKLGKEMPIPVKTMVLMASPWRQGASLVLG